MIDLQEGLCGYLIDMTRRQNIRSCTRKRRYSDRAGAEIALRDMASAGRAARTLRVYPCEFCDGFHLGNQD